MRYELPPKLAHYLREWDLDCVAAMERYGQELPQWELVKEVMKIPTRTRLSALAQWLHKEMVGEIGMMPAKGCKVHDAYSRHDLGLDYSIREEQHEVYWLIKDLLGDSD